MKSILNKAMVLVLNRNWQAINVRTPKDAFCQMATDVATALDMEGDEYVRPVRWEEWLDLPVRDDDLSVRTSTREIRVPTVIVALNYAQVPMKRPKLSNRSIRERDGNRCQYTGRELRADEGSIDHILPRSRGGEDSWENCVWSCKKVNGRKADRLPSEAGLQLLKQPQAPKPIPVTMTIRNHHGIPEWDVFLGG